MKKGARRHGSSGRGWRLNSNIKPAQRGINIALQIHRDIDGSAIFHGPCRASFSSGDLQITLGLNSRLRLARVEAFGTGHLAFRTRLGKFERRHCRVRRVDRAGVTGTVWIKISAPRGGDVKMSKISARRITRTQSGGRKRRGHGRSGRIGRRPRGRCLRECRVGNRRRCHRRCARYPFWSKFTDNL